MTSVLGAQPAAAAGGAIQGQTSPTTGGQHPTSQTPVGGSALGQGSVDRTVQAQTAGTISSASARGQTGQGKAGPGSRARSGSSQGKTYPPGATGASRSSQASTLQGGTNASPSGTRSGAAGSAGSASSPPGGAFAEQFGFSRELAALTDQQGDTGSGGGSWGRAPDAGTAGGASGGRRDETGGTQSGSTPPDASTGDDQTAAGGSENLGSQRSFGGDDAGPGLQAIGGAQTAGGSERQPGTQGGGVDAADAGSTLPPTAPGAAKSPSSGQGTGAGTETGGGAESLAASNDGGGAGGAPPAADTGHAGLPSEFVVPPPPERTPDALAEQEPSAGASASSEPEAEDLGGGGASAVESGGDEPIEVSALASGETRTTALGDEEETTNPDLEVRAGPETDNEPEGQGTQGALSARDQARYEEYKRQVSEKFMRGEALNGEEQQALKDAIEDVRSMPEDRRERLGDLAESFRQNARELRNDAQEIRQEFDLYNSLSYLEPAANVLRGAAHGILAGAQAIMVASNNKAGRWAAKKLGGLSDLAETSYETDGPTSAYEKWKQFENVSGLKVVELLHPDAQKIKDRGETVYDVGETVTKDRTGQTSSKEFLRDGVDILDNAASLTEAQIELEGGEAPDGLKRTQEGLSAVKRGIKSTDIMDEAGQQVAGKWDRDLRMNQMDHQIERQARDLERRARLKQTQDRLSRCLGSNTCRIAADAGTPPR